MLNKKIFIQREDKEVSKMKNINWVRKLTSRKLWMSVASFTSMMIVATGGTENQAAQVAALIMAGATALAYVIGEGMTDVAHKEVGEAFQIESSVLEIKGDD